ncbi:MAG: undecaprenyl-phosphate glucose phosphotransferase [Chitinophaga sp.]|uniref:undecaprenyl-phosphate glucose phosphotransferase n=1 Tax=Chitinophaga sp. TaxID=1869181 RepID=UPI001B2975F9|nr:undecaprenyl-phosphate glucose phosphotransferase [Chitinophaga sp.]MBO9732226.1 undecaprenyl-phosphate glucose phosphotransferase [Chitinophaga sp.]
MKRIISINFFVRLILDYIVLTAFFLLTREYIALKGDVFMSPFNFMLLGLSIFSWTIIGLFMHLYDDFRTKSFSFEFVAILKTVLLHGCFFTFLFFYVFKYYPYPRTFTLLYTGLIFCGIVTAKFAVKQILLQLRTAGYNLKNVLIIGAGETGRSFYKTMRANDHFGYRCVGFLDDERMALMHGQYLGKVADLPGILQSTDIDEVVVAIPGGQNDTVEKIIVASEREAKRVRIISECHRYCTPTASMHFMGSFPLFTVRTSPLDDVTLQHFKRLFEMIFTIILFVTVFSWLFPIIALLIKLTSKGPVFYKQERWGLKNKRISCYKFRSMVVNSDIVDEHGHYLQATSRDARVTPLGRILRKTNLDELPQFINVLMGDMSIVGPRPHPIPLHDESKNVIQHYMLRHLVKPGITGWAQVNGCRGETREPGKMQRRVDLDLWYIENYSFWLDCQIIFQTIMNMIKGDRNAY